jgi:hypothetical protein
MVAKAIVSLGKVVFYRSKYKEMLADVARQLSASSFNVETPAR